MPHSSVFKSGSTRHTRNWDFFWSFICWPLTCCMKKLISNLFPTVTAVWENCLWQTLYLLDRLFRKDADSLSYLHPLCKKMLQDTSDFSAFATKFMQVYVVVFGCLGLTFSCLQVLCFSLLVGFFCGWLFFVLS